MAKTQWIRPYVRATNERIGSTWTTSVRWFDPNGAVIREVSGPHVHAETSGYVSEAFEDSVVYHAVNGDWKVVLKKHSLLEAVKTRIFRKSPRRAGYIAATPDSRTFVHQFHPEEGQMAVDAYVLGKYVGTVGPVPQYLGRSVELGSDGSFALLAWKDKQAEIAEVIVAGKDGRISFRAQCEGPVDSPIAAPGGAGALVTLNLPGNGHETFVFYTESGKVSSLKMGPNPTFLRWLPNGTKSIFTTSVGYKHRYQLIDWQIGKILWDVADPASGLWERAVPRTAVIGEHVLLCGLEFMKLGEREGPVRSIYALDLASGKTAAHWLPEPNCHFSTDWGWFVRLDEKLFVIWGPEFAEIRYEDILAKKNGWRAAN
jgi:hypothetical protein